MKNIGVLNYQGGGELHIDALKTLGFNHKKITYTDIFEELDGLILPGGESSVQYKYCIRFNLIEKIKAFAQTGKPILGTCAGSILLSRFISSKVQGFGLIDIDIERNGYGRQIHSGVKVSDNNNKVMFIRAPIIKETGKAVTILDSYKSQPIFVKQENIFCTTFHPETYELDKNNILYKIFTQIDALKSAA
jgi:pyridoxal 5'-phosphate synthase pdxT subunit